MAALSGQKMGLWFEGLAEKGLGWISVRGEWLGTVDQAVRLSARTVPTFSLILNTSQGVRRGTDNPSSCSGSSISVVFLERKAESKVGVVLSRW